MLITTADNTVLNVEIAGPPDGPPILFIHGFPLTGEMWRHTAAALSDDYRTIVPDLRGLGQSPPLSDAETVVIATYARDLVGVLDAIGESRPVVVVGLSMGGMIALQLFRRHRARVRALVLCNTRAGAESLEGARAREERAAMVLARGAEGVRAVADAMIGPVLAPGVDAGVRQRVIDMMLTCHPTGVAAASRALASRADSWETLARFDCPVRFIGGEHDQITGPESMREMLDKTAPAAGATLTLIPGAGHIPPMEKPDEFVAALRRVLDEVA
jgi:pimeloyl-ACP methyl ester carboxylesterase